MTKAHPTRRPSPNELDTHRCVTQGLRFLEEMSCHTHLQEATKQRISLQKDELFKLTQQQRLRLAVVGEFSAGKSTFINALLQKELLAADIAPTTAVETCLKWGPSFQAEVRHQDEINEKLWPENQLSRETIQQALLYSKECHGQTFLQEDGWLNPAARKYVSEFIRTHTTESHQKGTVREVIIHLPSPYLRGAIDLIDTPGFNPGLKKEEQERHQKVTTEAVEKSHLALFVIDGRNPLKNTEQKYLQKFRPFLSRIFFVVNKMDLHDEEEGEDVESFVLDELSRKLGIEVSPSDIFFVTSIEDVSVEKKKYREQLLSLRERVLSFAERSRDRIVLEKTARNIGIVVDFVDSDIRQRFQEESQKLGRLRELQITDPEYMKTSVTETAVHFYQEEAAAFLDRLVQHIQTYASNALRNFQSYIAPVTEKEKLSSEVQNSAQAAFSRDFFKPLSGFITHGLTACVDKALESMLQEFRSIYANIDVPPVQKPSSRQIQEIVSSILQSKSGGAELAAMINQERGKTEEIEKFGAVGGAALGFALLGPIGLGLAGIGALLGSLFGPTVQQLKQKAIDQFEQQLWKVGENIFVLTKSVVTGKNPAFDRLLDTYCSHQISTFENLVREQIRQHEMTVISTQKAMKELNEASVRAKEIGALAKQKADELRNELSNHQLSEKSDSLLVLDQEAIDNIAGSLLGAVCAGALQIPNQVLRWYSGQGCHLFGVWKEQHQQAVMQALAVSELLVGMKQRTYQNAEWSELPLFRYLELTPMDQRLLFLNVSIPPQDKYSSLIAESENPEIAEEYRFYTYSKRLRPIQISETFQTIKEAVDFWKACLPEEICQKNSTVLRYAEQIMSTRVLQRKNEIKKRNIQISVWVATVVFALIAWNFMRLSSSQKPSTLHSQNQKFFKKDPSSPTVVRKPPNLPNQFPLSRAFAQKKPLLQADKHLAAHQRMPSLPKKKEILPLPKWQQTATLRLYSHPSAADVYVKGALYEKKTPLLLKAEKGTQLTLVLQKQGYQSKTWVWAANRNKRKTLYLLKLRSFTKRYKPPSPSRVRLYLQTKPTGALVFVEGSLHKQTTPLFLSFKKGKRIRILIKKQGYMAVSWRWEAHSDQTRQVDLTPDRSNRQVPVDSDASQPPRSDTPSATSNFPPQPPPQSSDRVLRQKPSNCTWQRCLRLDRLKQRCISFCPPQTICDGEGRCLTQRQKCDRERCLRYDVKRKHCVSRCRSWQVCFQSRCVRRGE